MHRGTLTALRRRVAAMPPAHTHTHTHTCIHARLGSVSLVLSRDASTLSFAKLLSKGVYEKVFVPVWGRQHDRKNGWGGRGGLSHVVGASNGVDTDELN